MHEAHVRVAAEAFEHVGGRLGPRVVAGADALRAALYLAMPVAFQHVEAAFGLGHGGIVEHDRPEHLVGAVRPVEAHPLLEFVDSGPSCAVGERRTPKRPGVFGVAPRGPVLGHEAQDLTGIRRVHIVFPGPVPTERAFEGLVGRVADAALVVFGQPRVRRADAVPAAGVARARYARPDCGVSRLDLELQVLDVGLKLFDPIEEGHALRRLWRRRRAIGSGRWRAWRWWRWWRWWSVGCARAQTHKHTSVSKTSKLVFDVFGGRVMERAHRKGRCRCAGRARTACAFAPDS